MSALCMLVSPAMVSRRYSLAASRTNWGGATLAQRVESKPTPAIRPSSLPRLTGHERFSNGDTVLNFWRWAMGDLRMNNARGYLAEYLVARAVGSDAGARVEWAGWDVKAPDGTRIEVKASGYLQNWTQKRPSRPGFGVEVTYPEQAWDEELGEDVPMPDGRVHVWVFALHDCAQPDAYDTLDLSTWRFWVAPHTAIRELNQKTAALSTIERIGQATDFAGLAGAIAGARAEHDARTAAPQ